MHSIPYAYYLGFEMVELDFLLMVLIVKACICDITSNILLIIILIMLIF